MTKIGKLVNMPRASLRELEQRLEHYIGDISGADARSERRKSILDAAVELFVGNGYRSTSIDQVADAVGIAKGTIYLHFKTKIDLLVAASSLEKLAFLARMEPLFDERIPAAERLSLWICTTLLLPREMPLASKLMAGNEIQAVVKDMPPELLAESAELQRRTLGHLIREVAPHRGWTDAEIDERLIVLSSVMMLSGMIEDDGMRQGLSIERYAEILGKILVDGLVGPVMLATALPDFVAGPK